MPVIRGNARHDPPVITISVIPAFGDHSSGQQCRALLDTGADGTSIQRRVAEAAGLQSRGKILVTGIGGQNHHRTWIAKIGIHTEVGIPSLPFVFPEPIMAIEMPVYQKFEAIIGRDLLMLGEFTLKSNGDFSWTIPG
jgi:predicted aspartyl protease